MIADLHRHLDGSLRRETLRALADEQGIAVRDDVHFVAGMGLDAALACFAVTLSVLQRAEAVQRVAAEICEDAAREDVTTLEIRFAPQLHHGAPMEEIVDAAIDGAAARAGIILCALYGEPPSLVDRLVEIARRRPGVVGIDLAGGPDSTHSHRMDDYAAAFTRARDLGIGRTVHAGEGRPPAEIRYAIERLHAQRIGHGTTLLDDDALVDDVARAGITIEACPTSNVHTGVIASVAEHPIARWLERGVRACVNTDNTLLSDVDARTELARVAQIPGMDAAKIAQVVAFGHAAAFRR